MARAHFALTRLRAALLAGIFSVSTLLAGQDALYPDPASLPEPGARDLRILTPEILEIRIVQGRASMDTPAFPAANLENPDFSLKTVPVGALTVTADGRPLRIVETGIKRVPVFAGYWDFDLRMILRIFLRLADPLPEGADVVVGGDVHFGLGAPLEAVFRADRLSPAIHVSAHGFAPEAPKFAFVSFDLGTLGEMDLPGEAEAAMVDSSGEAVFSGPLVKRSDPDWEWNQNVWRFDFSEFRKEGLYTVSVPGLGRSRPVRISGTAPAASARTLASGLYQQRSGADKGPPFTRFGHPASHTRPAEVPDMGERFKPTNRHIARMAAKNTDPKVQSAPQMDSVAASLYPILAEGAVDVKGGHYDAGDYSKYTINSAQLIHALTFATDHFPGVDRIDNLGLPESGDGIPDALQIARIEAEFLLKMQDADGGFFFLVYPRDRPYELDVLPEDGDPQVVFPKNTAATAAAVGALAQLAGSPAMRDADAAFANRCLESAKRGYAFLQQAEKQHGFDGSYQAISHYGNFDTHRDELAFAAAALFDATGKESYEADLKRFWPDPLAGNDKKWGWVPLYGFYGSAARIYAFAGAPGRASAKTGDPAYLGKMRRAIHAAALTWIELSEADAWGLPFSRSGKHQKRAGWFWAMDPAIDLAAAWLMDPDPAFRARADTAMALWSAYEAGGNPTGRAFISGTGPVWRRQIVNRTSLNDDRHIAPPGIPIGNVTSTPHNLGPYQISGASGLRKLFFPFLDTFPFYERSVTDAYNVREEWTVATGARLLAAHLFLMGRTAEAGRPWVPVEPRIAGIPEEVHAGDRFEVRVILPAEFNPGETTTVWEMPGQEPACGASYSVVAKTPGPCRIEVECLEGGGRRIASVARFTVLGGRKTREADKPGKSVSADP